MNSDFLSDLFGATSLIISLAAFVLSLEGYRRQAISSDIGTVVALFDRMNVYWDRYVDDPKGRLANYNLGQVLSYFEQTCYLINKKMISKAASECLSQRIISVWGTLMSDDGMRDRVLGMTSGEDTFKEIKEFAGIDIS